MMRTIIPFTILFLFASYCKINAQPKRLFDHNEGLSNSLINQVFQDHLGFIWVATEDGLNRFDGLKFISFSEKNKSSKSLKANFVTSLCEDKKGNLWVGQINGLQRYNHETESFEEIEIFINNEKINPYVSSIIEAQNGDIWITTSKYGLVQVNNQLNKVRYSTRLNKQLCSFYLECIFQDRDGLLWIGSDNDGFNTYNYKTGIIEHYCETCSPPFKIPSNDISSFCEDDKGNIYIGSIKGGLTRINKETQQLKSIFSANNEENIPVKSLLFDSKKRLWVGTDGMGLKLLNTNTDLLESPSLGSSSFDFSKSKIHSLIEDKEGNLWAGIFQKGLYLFPETPEIFNHYGYQAFGNSSIGSNCITAIDGDYPKLWIGTDGDGIYLLNRQSQKVEHLELKNANHVPQARNVLSLFNTPGDDLWIGTYFNGLIHYHKSNDQFKVYKNNPSNPNSLTNNKITTIKKGKNNTLWLATLGGGVCHFNPQTELFQSGLDCSDSLNNLIPQWVNDIYIDTNNNFWIGTYDGLIYAQPKLNRLQLFTTTNQFLPHNIVYCILPDSKGNIWVGTYGGLTVIDPTKLSSTIFTAAKGFGNQVVCAMAEDEYQQLWVSTHNGLSRYNPTDSTFTNYFASDGLQSNEFSRNAVYKSKKQELFFGGINGITEIKRDYKNFERHIRDVILTDFIRYDKPVKIGDKSGKYIILDKSITLADTVLLMERDNVFSIGFTSAELANQSQITYEYKMEGFDQNWNACNVMSRMATYTNLKHGTYTFYVRGVDKKQYSNIRKLTIIIYPPWFKTSWAKVLWVILTGIFLYGIIIFSKEKALRLEAEKSNEKKMQFFINISHEIKTPLTLIIDPLEKLLRKNVDHDTSRLYRTMQLNASRIFRLVNQLIDVRKIDKGQLLIKFQKTELYSFIKEIAQSYESLAANKKIDFEITTTHPNLKVWIDPLNFEKVILNLLSNAFKFTPSGGKVNIHITTTKNNLLAKIEQAKIIVSDNGIGIPKNDLEKIFNRFYQVNSKGIQNNTGTGIGLHLSRSLVKLHKGKLYATNQLDGSGSHFIISLPLGNSHLPKGDLAIEENILPTPSYKFSLPVSTPTANYEKEVSPSTYFKVMIVEDEEEIRQYLAYELKAAYKIITYENGLEAYNELMEEKPDLIISDIMMPEMDGINLCKKIKKNVQTNHIPVILLTALSKEEDRAQGIETGADMYLTKPFNSEFLKKIITNLLENRRRIYEKLQHSARSYNIENIELKSQDEILMQKVMTIIKDNISESNLNVEMLADGVGISRVHMHRKLKELTNQSARDFIKDIRMKQAAYILTTKKINISEVAYTIGYSNPSHFSNSFKAFYGVSPKEYVKNN